jgi:hypothetical protein
MVRFDFKDAVPVAGCVGTGIAIACLSQYLAFKPDGFDSFWWPVQVLCVAVIVAAALFAVVALLPVMHPKDSRWLYCYLAGVILSLSTAWLGKDILQEGNRFLLLPVFASCSGGILLAAASLKSLIILIRNTRLAETEES